MNDTVFIISSFSVALVKAPGAFYRYAQKAYKNLLSVWGEEIS